MHLTHQRSVGPLQIHNGGILLPVKRNVPGRDCIIVRLSLIDHLEVVDGARQNDVDGVMSCAVEFGIWDVEIVGGDFVVTEQESLKREKSNGEGLCWLYSNFL